MAAVLQLEFPGTTVLDLLDYSQGFTLAYDGWTPSVPPGDSDNLVAPVIETMIMRVKGDTADDLASKLQALDRKIEQARWYLSQLTQQNSAFLRVQLDGEFRPRIATVYSVHGAPRTHFFNTKPCNFIVDYRLTFRRMPYWEGSGTGSVRNIRPPSTDSLGGINDFGGPIKGDVPGRIFFISLHEQSGGPLYEYWVGFRTNRFGERGHFQPIWECEDGTLSNSTSTASDSAASGGSLARCTFGDASLLERVQIPVIDASPSWWQEQRGEFLVLLRAKVGSATTCRVRLSDGLSSSSVWRTGERVEVTSTDWLLHPLGTVWIPRTRSINLFQQYTLRLEADRKSGSGNLDMDCFVLIPTAEGSIHASGGYVVNYTTVEGANEGFILSGGQTVDFALVEPNNWAIPVGDGIFVLAAQRQASQVLTDTGKISLQCTYRWRHLRGTE